MFEFKKVGRDKHSSNELLSTMYVCSEVNYLLNPEADIGHFSLSLIYNKGYERNLFGMKETIWKGFFTKNLGFVPQNDHFEFNTPETLNIIRLTMNLVLIDAMRPNFYPSLEY